MRGSAFFVTVLTIVFFAGNVYGASADVTPEAMRPLLEKAKGRIVDWFGILDRDLSDAAGRLSAIDLASPAARTILKGLCIGRSSIMHIDLVSKEGRLIMVEPVDFVNGHPGDDLSKYEYIAKVRQTKKPVFSSVFLSSDKTPAFAMEYPIFSEKGDFRGSISIVGKPHLFFEYILSPILIGMPCKIWVMQTNGLVIYDPDPAQINRNIFTDPMFAPFPSLIEFSKKVSGSASGTGSYDFYARGYENKTIVRKDAVWDTAGIYDMQWRIIVMEITG